MQFKNFFSEIYKHLVKINDSNQRVAIGMGLGVFLGVLPGAGPIVSLILASIFRLNKAATLLGCLVTNTWISFVSALLAVQVGAFIFHLEWQKLWHDAKDLVQHFNFSGFFNLAVLKILAPVFVGYLIISFYFAFVTYLICLIALNKFRQNHSERRRV